MKTDFELFLISLKEPFKGPESFANKDTLPAQHYQSDAPLGEFHVGDSVTIDLSNYLGTIRHVNHSLYLAGAGTSDCQFKHVITLYLHKDGS